MFIFVIALLALSLFGIKLQKNNDKNSFMDRDNTLSIIGIFTILIFLTHICQLLNITYQTAGNLLDKMGALSLGLFGEQVVAPFLFYSGFGIALSFSLKERYLIKFPFIRIFKIILCFLFIVFFSLLITDLINLDFSDFGNGVLSLFSQLKNYWYIHAILICYSISFVIYLLNHFIKSNKFVIISHIFLSILLYIFCYFFLPFYRLCILCYFFGSLFYYLLPYFKNKLDSSKKMRIIFLLLSLSIYIASRLICYLLHYNGFIYQIFYQICNFGLCFSIVMITYFVSIKNKALVFLGKNTIYIYILLGLVSIIMSKFNSEFINSNSIIYVLISLPILLILSECFSVIFNIIWSAGLKCVLKIKNKVSS